MTIFGFLKTPIDSEPSSVDSAKPAQGRCVCSAREVARLVEAFSSRWGLKFLLLLFTRYVTVALFTLLEALDEDESRASFLQLCVIARSFAHRFPIGKGMLRLVQLSAK